MKCLRERGTMRWKRERLPCGLVASEEVCDVMSETRDFAVSFVSLTNRFSDVRTEMEQKAYSMTSSAVNSTSWASSSVHIRSTWGFITFIMCFRSWNSMFDVQKYTD